MVKFDNKTVLIRGWERASHVIENVIFNILYNSAGELLLKVAENREFEGFTGNTQTSYMIGIYQDGRLKEIINQENWKRRPVHPKIPRGERLYLKNPYEGEARAVKGAVAIGESHLGFDTSVNFLRRFHPRKHGRGGFTMVITTGTEYSVYIEEVRDLDVLTKTFIDAPGIIKSNWKKIEF